MRPENSSNVWLNTFCEESRASTLLSSVTPVRPACMAEAEIPLAAASFLKSSSHVSNGPVPQGADNAGIVEVSNSAPRVRARRERREIIVPFAPQRCVIDGIAFSSEVGTGSRDENASKQESRT